MQQPSAEAIVDRIIPVVRSRLPAGVTPAYFDGFVGRNRRALIAILARQLAVRGARSPAGTDPGARTEQPPDLWSASQRTAANLAAMHLAARQRPEEMDAADRSTLAAYSGWGGLSLQAAAPQFPTGFPVPEERGLIHLKLRYRNFLQPPRPCAAHPWDCTAPARPRRSHPPGPAGFLRLTGARRPPARGSRPRASGCPR